MLSLFEQNLLKKNIISSQHRILCAVSGGVDSMVMLDLFVKAGYKVGVAHINHRTRNGGSDRDEDFLNNYCAQSDLPFYSLKLSRELSKKSNFQENARILRYEFFKDTKEKYGYDFIATAHHKDDDVETFFINLFRGAGLRGLSGIAAVHASIIRPLKIANKEDIIRYQKELNVPCVEDESNAEDDYLRNNIRLNLLPLLKNIDDRSIKGIQRSMDHLHASHQLLKRLIESKFINHFDAKTPYLNKFDLPDSREEVLTIFHYSFGAFGFNETQYNDLLDSNRVGSFVESESFKLVNDYKTYAILDRNAKEEYIEINDYGEYFLNDGRRVEVKKGVGNNSLCFKENPFPLILRKKQPGDSFKPKGMNGNSKTIKKYLVDAKVNAYEKSKLLVLENEQKIISLLGLRDAEGFEFTRERAFCVNISII